MDLFTYLMAKKGQNTQRDLFSYLLGKGAGGSGTYVNFTGASLNISNTLKARIKNITLKGATSQDGTPTPETPIPIKVVTGEQNVNVHSRNLFNKENYIDNYYIDANGSHVYQNGDFIGDYINVNTGNYIASGSLNIIRCATYDKDKNFIRRKLSTNGSSLLITITSEEKFVRLSGYKTSLDTLQFEPGSTATTYTPYYSKDYPLSFGSWNLLNYDLEAESYYYDSSGNKTYDNIFKYINQRIEVGLGSSITCTAESRTSNALMRICEFASNDLFIKRTLVSTTEYTITLDNATSYIIVSIDKSNDRYFLKPQITKGTDIKPYCPYSEHYNENPLELAKIGTYQDYIYGTPNNWYKYKYVNSRELTVYNVNTSYSNLVYATISKPNDYLGKSNYGDYRVLFGKGQYLYKTGNTWDTTEYINKILPNGNNNLFYFGMPSGTTKEQAEEILNGTKLYYPIEPTTEQITDTTLIEQLNNLYNATSQDGTTIITCSSASDSNEIIVFSGDIKVTSVGNSLNTSLLSSDIQEEPNLDDINETEDIEQNEEPIEEEVS